MTTPKLGIMRKDECEDCTAWSTYVLDEETGELKLLVSHDSSCPEITYNERHFGRMRRTVEEYGCFDATEFDAAYPEESYQ